MENTRSEVKLNSLFCHMGLGVLRCSADILGTTRYSSYTWTFIFFAEDWPARKPGEVGWHNSQQPAKHANQCCDLLQGTSHTLGCQLMHSHQIPQLAARILSYGGRGGGGGGQNALKKKKKEHPRKSNQLFVTFHLMLPLLNKPETIKITMAKFLPVGWAPKAVF